VRDAVALFDQSGMGKILVTGPDALSVLDKVSTARIDVAAGRVVYTCWLDERGGIVSDLTVTRLSETEFLVITATASLTRDLAWLRERMPADARCAVVDVTSSLALLALMGPKSRALLEALSGEDLSNAAFPFATSRELEVGYARLRATRLTYVGELGFELWVPADQAVHLLERILEVGPRFGLAPAGRFAQESCRIEKAYRSYGHDIGIEDDPFSAGLGFTVALDKPGGFIGREALLARRAAADFGRRRLVAIRLADPSVFLHREEPILEDGRIVGSVSSGAFGHRLGASLGLGWMTLDEPVTAERLARGRFAVEVAGEPVPAELSLRPFYDPSGSRVRS
jgi:4-methylaminobutanoate oxidase (formaldehyde-forming)